MTTVSTPCSYCGSPTHARIWCLREEADRANARMAALEAEGERSRQFRIRELKHPDTAPSHMPGDSAGEKEQ